MTAIQKGIETLTSFAERAEKLDDGPSTNSKSKVVKFTAPLNAIRDNASRVHKVLIQRYCMSHKRHRAAILLEDRMLRRKRGRIVNKTQVASDVPSTAACFTLCLDEHLPASKWISTEFRIIESSTRYGMGSLLSADNVLTKSAKAPIAKSILRLPRQHLKFIPTHTPIHQRSSRSPRSAHICSKEPIPRSGSVLMTAISFAHILDNWPLSLMSRRE
jgi:hypothetical protein